MRPKRVRAARWISPDSVRILAFDLPAEHRPSQPLASAGTFDPLTRGKIRELFATSTNLTPDDFFGGKIVVINLPVARYREVGQYAALIWAQFFQRAVDRRVYAA